MSPFAWSLVILVGILNIAFNVNGRVAATNALSWSSGIFTLQFLLFFLIGCASMFALYTLYFQEVILARAIVLMGAVSIIGGTTYGLLRGGRLDWSEYAILGTLLLLFIYRLALVGR